MAQDTTTPTPPPPVPAEAVTAGSAVDPAAALSDASSAAVSMVDASSAALLDPGATAALASTSAPMTPEQMLAGNDAVALTKMGFAHLLEKADSIGIVVLLIMAVMSVLSWYYIFFNSFRLFAVQRRARRVVEDFWNAASPQEATDNLRAQPEYEPFSKIALDASEAAEHYGEQAGGRMSEVLSRPEFIGRRLQHALKREASAFDSGLTLLATVGSTAPFVGLFGTVWGIYHALIGIGAAGKATLDVVAGPVGEALIMTCIGLGVAIPAVLMYNFFVRANKGVTERLYGFGNDLLDYFATGSRVSRSQRYGGRQQTGSSQASSA